MHLQLQTLLNPAASWQSSECRRPFTYHRLGSLKGKKHLCSPSEKATEDERAPAEVKPADQLGAAGALLCEIKLITGATPLAGLLASIPAHISS